MHKSNLIITIPNPALHQKSQRVKSVDADIKHLISTMEAATLDWDREHETGAALAAVQIADLRRVIIIRDDFEDRAQSSFTAYLNPEIVKTEGVLEEDLEGCLSVPGIYAKVPRWTKIKVKAMDLSGREIRLTATGFLARVFQHEIDHTEGFLIIDRVKDTANLFQMDPVTGHLSPLQKASA